MKPTVLLFCATLFFVSCNLATAEDPTPRGVWTSNDEGGVLVLPDGGKFVSRSSLDDNEVKLTFPNGQVFTAETGKIDPNPPFVNEDGTLVAVERIPATKTGDLHLYIKGSDGKFKEVPDVNEKIGKLLEEAKVDEGSDVLRLRALDGRTITLWSINYEPPEFTKYEFKVEVAADGSLSLVR